MGASHHGDSAIVCMLLAYQADVNAQNEVRSMEQFAVHKNIKLTVFTI